MKKAPLTIIVVVGMLFVFIAVCRLSGFLQYYEVASPADFPNLKVGHLFLSSNLVKPKNGDFICFKAVMPHSDKEDNYVFRLYGSGGDVVEVKNGYCFINGLLADSNIHLAHSYITSSENLPLIQKQLSDIEPAYSPSPDSVILNLPDAEVAEKHLPIIRFNSPFTSELYNPNSQQWTTSNYGPVTVPAGKYFVLGDNRDNSYDSRYIGFIDQRKFTGTVIYY
ncbi:MAG: signal peptidase I [Chitinophagales bacterium]